MKVSDFEKQQQVDMAHMARTHKYVNYIILSFTSNGYYFIKAIFNKKISQFT